MDGGFRSKLSVGQVRERPSLARSATPATGRRFCLGSPVRCDTIVENAKKRLVPGCTARRWLVQKLEKAIVALREARIETGGNRNLYEPSNIGAHADKWFELPVAEQRGLAFRIPSLFTLPW